MLNIRGRGEDRDQIGIRGVDHGQIALGHARPFERARQQVMGHAELDQIDRRALQPGHVLRGLGDDAVIAVGEVADDQGSAVDAADRRNGQRVHVGHDAAVEAAGGILVDRFDIVVDLHDLDLEAVFVGPFLDDALIRGVAPRHPADIDRPGDAKAGLGIRCLRAGGAQHAGQQQHREPSREPHRDLLGCPGRLERQRRGGSRVLAWRRTIESPGLLSRRGSADPSGSAGVPLSDQRRASMGQRPEP